MFRLMCWCAVMSGCLGQLNVCGRAPLNSRIVGGQDAPPGAWPWLASVHVSGVPTCGGSLINSQWVLAAAQCFPSVSASDVVVYLGRQSQSGSNPNEVSRRVSQLIVHDGYDFFSGENDIALLQLSSSVAFTDYIRPVCLAATGSVFIDGTISWVTGFGNVDGGALQEVQVPVIENCKALYGDVVTDNMICAGLLAGGKDACQAYIGSPMVIPHGAVWIQAGVSIIGCNQAGSPRVFSRVSLYQDWISAHIPPTADQPGYIQLGSADQPGFVQLGLSPPTLHPQPTTSLSSHAPPTPPPPLVTTLPLPDPAATQSPVATTATTQSPVSTAATTTQSPPSTAALRLTLDQVFSTDLANPASTAYQELEQLIKTQLHPVLKSAYTTFISLSVTSFRSGSVIAHINTFYSAASPTEESITNTIQKAIDTGSLATLKITTFQVNPQVDPGRSCRPRPLDNIAIPTVWISVTLGPLSKATDMKLLANNTLTQLEHVSKRYFRDPEQRIAQVLQYSQREGVVDLDFQLTFRPVSSPSSIRLCFPGNGLVRAALAEAFRSYKQLEIRNITNGLSVIAKFETDIVYEEALGDPNSSQFKNMTLRIVRVIDNINRAKYGILYKRTIVLGFRPRSQSRRSKRATPTEVELQEEFESNSTDATHTHSTFPSSDDVRDTLKKAADNSTLGFRLDLNTVSIADASKEEASKAVKWSPASLGTLSVIGPCLLLPWMWLAY